MSTLRIKKLGVLSVAKMYAAMAFVISLLIAIPYGLFIIIFSLVGAAGAKGNGGGIQGQVNLHFRPPMILESFASSTRPTSFSSTMMAGDRAQLPRQ